MHISSKILTNQYSIYKYTDNLYKVIFNKMPIIQGPKSSLSKKNENKLDNNISRARNKIFEYAICNQWDYFITLTLNKDKQDRYNLENYIKKLSQFIRDERKRGFNIQYLLVPEKHKDGAWHMHGLIKGISDNDLTINKNGYKEWYRYSDRFGYCSIDEIKNHEAVSKYITKYVSKSINAGGGVTEYNKKLYYVSRGLNKAEKTNTGYMEESVYNSIKWEFNNEYCNISYIDLKEYEKLDKNLQMAKNSRLITQLNEF